MRIRKRSALSSGVATPTPQPLPMSYKYQSTTTGSAPREGRRGERSKLAPECSNMQAKRGGGDVEDHEAPESRSDGTPAGDVAENPPPPSPRGLSDAHVEEKSEAPGTLADTGIADYGRRKQSSPTKRRKIEHDASLNVLEGLSSMTAAELLAVTELANGVRQRQASELSTLEPECEKVAAPENASSSRAGKSNSNSKDALISSIFFVFDTHGDHGLSASEVVKSMIDQRLPGLKEGGARHTVQVANVLRSSSSFFSLGDKKYLLCASVDNPRNTSTTTETAKSSKPSGHTRINISSNSNSNHINNSNSIHKNDNKSKSKVAGDDSSDTELAKAVTPKRRLASSNSSTRTGKKIQVEKPKDVVSTLEGGDEVVAGMGASSSEPAVVVRVARRRGPSSSQKGKGPTQCKRYDGRGWQCSRLTEPGYSLCVHHQDLINKRAAKLKQQQTISRLMESVQRKAKSQTATPADHRLPAAAAAGDVAEAPVQKRKMLSLLAISK